MQTEITVSAPINMALIKYWGKRDEALILPCNSSISVTLASSDLLTVTSVRTGPEFLEDSFYLNDQKEQIDGRLKACIEKVLFIKVTLITSIYLFVGAI